MLGLFLNRQTTRLTTLLNTRVLLLVVLVVAFFSLDRHTASISAQTVNPIVAVSAASFGRNRPVASGSIAAVFTANVLAPGTFIVAGDAIPGTPSFDLPTLLGNFTVEVHGRSAGIFSMINTPGFDQLNILIPSDLESGKGPLVVKNAAGQIVAAGEIEVAAVTPAIFTANSAGTGVPAALVYRYRNGVLLGVENVFQFNQTSGFIPRPIDLGAADEELFLVLFLTGIKKLTNPADTRVLIGGEELIPVFAGPQGTFSGLDQVNVRLSRTLRGRLTLAFIAIGNGTSNLTEIEIAQQSSLPPTVAGLSKPEALAGELIEVMGNGFSSDSEVLISDSNRKLYNAKIIEARTTSLRVLVPYGAGTGNLVVRNSRGEASFPFKMRTSMSGIVQTSQKQLDGSDRRIGVPRVTIRLVGQNLPPVQTNDDGSFLMPDVPPTNPLSSGLVFEVDGSTNGVLPLAKERRRIRVVTSGRDNPFPEYIELKPESDQSVPTISPGALPDGAFAFAAQANPSENEVTGQTGQVVFEPNGSTVQFPGGALVNRIKITVLDTGRTPADLPFGNYSSTIVQLSPLGATVAPGGKLTFPNTDGLPPNKQVTLFRFDQTPNSNTIGRFVSAGPAQVSADGLRVVSGQNAVIESTYYFASDLYPTTTIYGKVVEANTQPARGALVQVKGQSIFSLTDDNGSFVLLNVPIVGNAPTLTVEVSFLRPNGTVDRAERTGVIPNPGALTYVSPPIILPGDGSSRAPAILSPKNLSIEAGKTSDFSFLAYARVAGLNLQPVTVSGAAFASVLSLGNDRYTLRLSPAIGATGSYTLTLTATDSQPLTTAENIDLEVKPPNTNVPIANGQSAVTNEDTPVNLVLSGSGGTAFRIVNQPLRGRLEGTPPNVQYRPNQDFNGPDTFTFVLGNGSLESAPALVSIAVQPVADRPLLEVGNSFATNIGQRLNFVITGRDGDEGQTLTLTSIGLPQGATITQTTASSWLFDWTPNSNQIGGYALNLTLRDNGAPSLSDGRTIALTVDAKWARSPGIDGGLIQGFLVNGTTLFVALDFGGVFRSNDNGASWAPSGLPNRDVIALASTGGAIYAATDEGVFRSTDNGAGWSEVNNGLPKLEDNTYRAVLCLAVSGNSIFAGTTSGAYRTSNNGADWTIASNGLPKGAQDVLRAVNTFLVTGSTIYAGTFTGVYRTIDNGANWVELNNGLPIINGLVAAVFAIGLNGGNLFAATIDGVFRSTNNGANWTAANNGLTDTSVRALIVSGGILYAGTLGSGIFTSADNGNTWTERGLADEIIYALMATGGTIYAGSFNSIFRTTDGGANWTKINSGLANLWVYSITGLGTSIFTGTDDGVYRTTDNGSSWVRTGLANRVVDFVGIAGSAILAGSSGLTFRSTDDGASWTDVSATLDYSGINSIVPVATAHLAATNSGLFRSSNNGLTWAPFGAGLPVFSMTSEQRPLTSLAVLGSFVFVGTQDGGIYRSSDSGATWTRFSNGVPIANEVYAYISRLLTVNSTLFAGTQSDGILRSTDNGANWVALNNGLDDEPVFSLAASGNTIYAGVLNRGVYRSSDNGTTWVPSGLTDFLNVFALFASGSSIFAGTTEGGFVLAEAALAWTETNAGLASKPINAATYDTASFLVGSNSGVYRSIDDGRNWQPSNSGLPPAPDIRVLLKTANGVFTGIAGSGVYFSSDQGQNWAARNTPGLSNLLVNALSSDGAALYAGTEGGVFRSIDSGQNWSAINSGLTRMKVLCLSASSAGIFAGTDNGLFRYNTQSGSWSTVHAGLTDLYIASLGVAPNGTNILAGTAVGVFLSSNQGGNWAKVSRGISERVVALTFTPAGTKLLAGTVNGFYLSDDNGQSWVVNNTGLINPQVSALAIKGSLVLAGTRSAGVFFSQIPDVLTNHPPAIAFSCASSLTTNMGSPVNCTITRSDPDASQTTTLTAGGLLAGSTFNSTTGDFSWTPNARQPGVHFMTFTATDNGNPRLASSRELMVTVNSPVPVISSLSPLNARAGGTAFSLTVNGSNFVTTSDVRWNGINRPTEFTSGNGLIAQISAADIAAAGNALVTVFTPTPGGGGSNSVSFAIQPGCTYQIAPTSQAIAGAGGTGGVAVTAGTGCTWTATSNAATFITVTSGASGSGNGTVNYSVALNSTTSARSGTITIAGQTFTVNQAAGSAGTTVNLVIDDATSEQTIGQLGGGSSGAVNRLTPGSYPATLTGVEIIFPTNQNIPNNKAFTVLYGSVPAGQTSLSGITLQEMASNIPTTGAFFTYTVPNLTITSGDFVVGYRIAHANNEFPVMEDFSSGSRRRSYFSGNGSAFTLIDNTVGLAGNFLIRAKANVPCTPTIATTSQSFGSSGGTGTVNVTNAVGCTWSAFSNVNWINITSGPTGSGNAPVNYSVIVNLATLSRSGTMTIAGRTFTVTQAPGTSELVLDDGTFEQSIGSGGTGTVTVSVVNRFTPPVYPLTITGISIVLHSAIPSGRAITLLYGTLPSNAPNLSSVVFQELARTTQTAGQFNLYTIPNLTVSSGDVVLGYRIQHNAATEFPVAIDLTSPKGRSYYFDQVNWVLIGTYPGLDSNFGIRARVIPPAGFQDEFELPLSRSQREPAAGRDRLPHRALPTPAFRMLNSRMRSH